jgi:hypothetical protein
MTIYFVRAGTDGPVKIGWSSTNTKRRHGALQTSHYVDLIILREVVGDKEDEKAFHRYFADKRIKNEWFAYDERMLSVRVEDARRLLEPAPNANMKPLPSLPFPFVPMVAADLLAYRKRFKLSRQRLGELLGISPSRLADYERGITRGRNTPAPIPRMVQLALEALENTP